MSLSGVAAMAPAVNSVQASAAPSLNSRDNLDLAAANSLTLANGVRSHPTGKSLNGVQPMIQGPVSLALQTKQSPGIPAYAASPDVPGGPRGEDAPEPSTAMLLGLGVILAGASYRRRRR